tara:strand:- start:2748 stop:2933 length:186 start_codon:yes stop_codon:yes gene_type:complete
MQLRLNPKSSRSFSWGKTAIKVGLVIFAILVVIFFLGQLKLSAPKKLIKQEISNDKLIKLK